MNCSRLELQHASGTRAVNSTVQNVEQAWQPPGLDAEDFLLNDRKYVEGGSVYENASKGHGCEERLLIILGNTNITPIFNRLLSLIILLVRL